MEKHLSKDSLKIFFLTQADNLFKPIEQGGLGVLKMQQLFGTTQFNFSNPTQFRALLNSNPTFESQVLSFVKSE